MWNAKNTNNQTLRGLSPIDQEPEMIQRLKYKLKFIYYSLTLFPYTIYEQIKKIQFI